MPPSFLFEPVRTRLLAEVETDTGLTHKVLSIVAPVGYGKTVLMSALFAHLRSLGELCFWIALDDRDTSVERVLRLLEDLARGPEFEPHPTQALFRGDEPAEVRVDALHAAAAKFPSPLTIFVDNLNCCTDDTLGALLDNLVFRSSASVRFVFSSTVELPLNFARAKLEGLVRQIGYADLSLNAEELGALLGFELTSVIGAEGVDAVARRTEGWPAAARMAQIVLSAADDPAAALAKFSGSDEDIADLLNRQVLSGFPPDVREFLLCVAQLRTFSVDLCRHASGNEAADRHLALLLRRNVLVIPMDRNRTWYRLHNLFREFLLNEADRSLPAARRREVLTRAAEWCEHGGYWRDSIDYALAGDAATLACRILEGAAAIFVRDRGDIPLYIAWVEKLHAQGHQLGWEAEYWYAWALVFHRFYELGRQRAEQLAKRIRQELPAQDDASQRDDLLRRIDIIRTCVDIFTDRPLDARKNAARWLAGEGADDPFNVAAASGAESICYASAFQFVQARQSIQVAQAAVFQANSNYAYGWIAAINALTPLLEGNYAAVHPEIAAALASARMALGDGPGICGTIALIGAKCAVEMGRDEEAHSLLALGMRTSKIHGFVDAAACGLDAAVKLWSGADDDRVSIPRLREIASSYPPRLSFMLSCFLVQRLVRLGRMDQALTEAAHIGLELDVAENRDKLPPLTRIARSRDAFVAAEIDLGIAAGRHKQVEPLIASETRLAKAEGRAARLVELALAETMIAVHANNPQVAIRQLTRAVSLAALRRIVRPFRDRAEMIAAAIGDTKPSAWGFALAEERKFFAEICSALPIGNHSLQDRLVALNMESHLLDPLTARQMELLGLLDAGLSNQQLADQIGVSLTTIKWHLQQLYAKFGVSSRSAALARARVLNLLPR
ncbi:MAG: LuxR C-terminal-related transcriptional regulator [Rhodocyclaceae bacterium]|nr:LuxR C-terminal-related transcriptional regulator [Rhodocyclaceae bacterium]